MAENTTPNCYAVIVCLKDTSGIGKAYNKAGHTAHFVRWTRYTAFRSPVPAALSVMRTIEEIFKEMEQVPVFDGHTISSVKYRSIMGDTPLHIVANCGDCEAIEILVAAGADINAIGESGYTPLHCAVEQGHPNAVRLLVSLGATSVENDYGDSPLKMASDAKNDDVIYALIENT